MMPYNNANEIVRNADVPNSLPIEEFELGFGDVCPERLKRYVVILPYFSICDPATTTKNIQFNENVL